jgi:L-galactose dehydrogenase
MQYRTLGRTGLKVSLLGYGSGGPGRLGQKTGLSSAQQDALIRRCLELGVNLFDTAENYMRSEEILGRALGGVPRSSYILATKWSPRTGGGVKERPDKLVASVEKSLRLLRTDYVDVMQFHGVLPSQYHHVVECFHPTMERLRREGKIRFIGITELFFYGDPRHEALAMALADGPELWDTVMMKYGILNQSAARTVLPLAAEHNVGVLNMGPVRVKLTRPAELEALISEWKGRGLIPPDALPDEDPLGWLVGGDVDSVVSAGYKFAADHPAVSTVLTGTSSIEHLEANAAALAKPCLPDDASRRLAELFGGLSEGV